MKKIMLAFILTITLSPVLYAQQIERYFDYKWNRCELNMARFLSVIKNTDSGWVSNDYFIIEKSLQMKGLYKDSACKIKNGYFYFFHPNGTLESKGKFIENKKDGLWLSFHDNQFMSDSTVYDNGEPTGTSMAWFRDGTTSDSTARSENGSAVAIEWFDNGNVSSAGRLNAAKQYIGRWQFFHRNGHVSASELYDNGKLVDKKYFDEDGTSIADTSDKWVKATFPGGNEAWLKYLSRNIFFPGNVKLINADKAVVVVSFSINENGEVKDVALKTPFHPIFNNLALQAVKRSPRWIPGVNHNRKIKYNWTQTLNFNQVVE